MLLTFENGPIDDAARCARRYKDSLSQWGERLRRLEWPLNGDYA